MTLDTKDTEKLLNVLHSINLALFTHFLCTYVTIGYDWFIFIPLQHFTLYPHKILIICSLAEFR